jgi:hypothetical protein
MNPEPREPAATLHDIAQGITVKQALRYSRVSLEEIAEILADQWRIRGSDLADLQERHRMMRNGVNVAQAGMEATIQQLRDALGDVRWRAGSFGLHCASCGVPEGRPHNAECPIDALLGQP